MMRKINRILQMEDWFSMGVFIQAEFGVCVHADDLRQIVAEGRKICEFLPEGEPTFWNTKDGRKIFKERWSDESWRAWIKNRISDKYLTAGCKYAISFEDWISATMHVFFIYLEENEYMLYRLRHAKESTETEVATSKIFDDAGRVPTPVDRTAKRVARPPKNKKKLNQQVTT